MRSASRSLVSLSLVFLLAAWSAAQDEPKDKAPAKPAEKKKAAIDAAKEDAALAFAREHHPELAELLAQLSTSNRREYDKAIGELSQISERLQRVKKAAPNRYAEELEKWKLDSRIKLLAAKSSMADDPELEAQLKEAVKNRVDFRLRDLMTERNRLTARLKKIEEEIKRIEADPAKEAEKDLKRVKGSIRPDPKKTVTKGEKKKTRQARKAKKAEKAEKAAAKAVEKPPDNEPPAK